MGELTPLEIKLYADVARLRQDMNQAKGIVGDAASGMQNAFNMASRAFAALGLGITAAGFGSWVKGAIDPADETAKLAQRAGLATEKVAGLTLAFQQSGAGGADVLQKSMVKLSTELVMGNKTLEAMGIKTRDAREAFGQIADKIAAMGDGTSKTAAVVEIFGERIGANLIPLLNAGSKGLEEMDKLAADLGLTLDSETTRAAESFNDAMDSVAQGVQGTARSIMKDLLPALEAVALEMAEASKNGGAFAGVGEALSVAFEALVVLGSDVMFVFRGIWREVSTIAKQAKALATEGLEAAAALHRQAIADAAADRDRLDAFQRRLLMARDIAKSTKDAADLDEAWVKRAKASHDAATKAAERHAEALVKVGKAAKNVQWPVDTLQVYQADQLREAFETIDKINKAWKPADIIDSVNVYEAERLREAFEAIDKVNQANEDAQKRTNDAILADWQRTVDQMAQSLTDALMTGGKSIAGYLQGLFRTLVLRPILMPAATAFSGSIAGVANAATGSGGGGMGSMLNIGGALGGVGTFGTAAGVGVGATLAGGSLGGILGGAGAMIGQGSIAGVAGGLGLGLGAIAPYAMAAYGLYLVGKKLFGRKLEDAGVSGTFSGAGDFSGNSYEFYKGGLLRSDKTKRSELDGALELVLDSGAKAATETVKAYAEVLGLPVQAMEGYTQKIKLSLKGRTEQEIQQAIAKAVDDFGAGLASLYEPMLAPFQKAGERIFDTLQRLSVLEKFSTTLADLGGAFGKVAGLSFDARESLIAMAGGMDQLMGKATAFVQAYYNRDEIAGVKARDISQTLQGVGITQDLSSTEDFRKLLESLDISTTDGQTRFNTLLDVAPDFADVAAYLKEAGGPETLREAAAQAPDTMLSEQLAMSNRDQVSAINGVALGIGTVVDVLRRIEDIFQNVMSKPAEPTKVVVAVPEVNGAWFYEQPTGGA